MSASEAATSYLLRIEGVNLAYFIFDTDDLSTIRGGGLLLLFAPDLVQDEKTWRQLADGASEAEVVASGASQTILRFTANSRPAAERVTSEVRKWLQLHEELSEATFVVDVRPESGDFAVDKEYLLAANRWQQMQQPRLVVPAWNDATVGRGTATAPCDIDFVRPATDTIPAANVEKRQVSRSVAKRRKYGVDHKQQLYKRLTGWTPRDRAGATIQLARDFHAIAARGAHRYGVADDHDGDPLAHLHDKMAVLYIDGNKFGDIQRTSCHSAIRQQAWDGHVQGLRKEVLKTLLSATDEDDEWICDLGTASVGGLRQIAIRLETLLWGGDELTWVVPAWKGWQVLETFFAATARWPKWKRNDTAELQLTHAAGLVFCHASSPIHGVTSLAHDLAEQGKQWNKTHFGGDLSQYQDVVAYQVLESFDHLGDEIAKARGRHLPDGCSPDDLVIPAGDLRGLTADLVQPIRDGFPRGSVYRLLRALQRGDRVSYERSLERAHRDHAKVPDSFSDHPVRWLHLSELWDYIGHLPLTTITAE